MSDLNDLEITIRHRIEGGLDLQKSIKDVESLGNKAAEASGKIDKLNASQKAGGSAGSRDATAQLNEEIEALQKKIRLFEQQQSLVARSREDVARLRADYKEENLKAEGDAAAQIRAIGEETAARIQQSEADKVARREEAEATRRQITLERELNRIREQAAFASARTPGGRASAMGMRNANRLAGLEGMGASKEQIEEAAAAFKKLETAASAASIPLFQLSPVIGYQAAMMLRLASSAGSVAAGLSAGTIAAGAFAAVVAGIGIGVVAGANSLGEYARQMKNFSEDTGLSVIGAQEFVHVTGIIGDSAKALIPAIGRLNMALAEGGEQNAKNAEAFRMLGIEARNAHTGALEPMDTLLPKIFRGLRNMKDEATANAIAHQLFGRGINQLLSTFREYDDVLAKVKATGVIVDAKTLGDAEQFHQKIQLLKEDWNALVLALEKKAVGVIDIMMPGGISGDRPTVRGAGVPGVGGSGLFGRLAGIDSYPQSPIHPITDPNGGAAELTRRMSDRLLYQGNRKANADALLGAAQLSASSAGHADLTKAEKDLRSATKMVEEDERNGTRNQTHLDALSAAASAAKVARDRIEGEREYRTELKQTERVERESRSVGLEGIEKLRAAHAALLADVKNPGLRARQASAFAFAENQELVKESNAASDVVQRGRMEADVRGITDRVAAQRRAFSLQARVRDARQSLTDPTAKHDFAADRSFAVQSFGAEDQGVRDRFQREMEYANTLPIEKERITAVENAEKHRAEGFSKAAKDHIEAVLKIAAAETEAGIAEQKHHEESVQRIVQLRAGYEVQAIRRRASSQISMLGSNAQPGDELHLAQQERAIRLDAEGRITAERIKQIALEKDHDKQREEAERVLGELTAERSTIEFQYAERVAAIRRQEMDRSRSIAGGLFGALTDSRGPGAGLQNFLRSETLGMQKTMFENLLGPIIQNGRSAMSTLIPGQRDTNGNLTGLGKIFAGTALGDKGRDATELQIHSTDKLTDANVKLKDAIDLLTQYISGSGGNVTITGAGSNTNVIIPGDGASMNSLPNRQISLPLSIPGIGSVSPWMQAALGIGGAAATTVGGLAAAGLFDRSGFNVTHQNGQTIMQGGQGPGVNILQTAFASLTGLVTALSSIGKVLSPDSTSGLSQLVKGASSISRTGTAGLFGAISGHDYTVQTGPGQYATASSLGLLSPAARTGAILGDSAGLVAGGFQAYQGFKQGGARGALAGTGAILGTAAAFDPEPISKGILAAASVVTGIVGALLGDPKVKYDQMVSKALQTNRYLAPPTLNETIGAGGFDINYNKNGRARILPFQGLSSAMPFMTQDPFNQSNYLTIPGQIFHPGQFGGPVTIPSVSPSAAYPGFMPAGRGGTNVHITVHAMDSKNVLDHAPAIGQAIFNELQKGGALAQRIQSVVLGS